MVHRTSWKARLARGVLWATPGQLDAGLASLATFLAGLIAVRLLSPESLAGYALLFSSFLVASQIPAELIFSPSQVLAVDMEEPRRLGMLRHSYARGILISAASAILVPLGILPLLGEIDIAELLPLALSASALVIVSPLQDHMRSMLHLAGRSWWAAATSAAHFVGTSLALFLFVRRLPSLAPFGALVAGNVISLGLMGFRIKRLDATPVPKPSFRELKSLGSWLLATGLARTLLGYATRSVLSAVAGVSALGFVEGARVVAQPIYVLASGLTSQVGPKATEAGARRDVTGAKRWRKRFYILLSLAALPYSLVTAFPSLINPFAAIAPRAYTIPGLTAATLAAVWLNSLLRPMKSELIGARLQRQLMNSTIGLGIVEVGLVFTGYKIGAFAAPASLAASAILMFVLLARILTSFYRQGVATSSAVANSGPLS